MDPLRMLSFRPFVIKKQEPPPIPKEKEKLEEILKQNLEITERQAPVIFGTTSECAIKLRCPFCKSEFTGYESSGCFHHEIIPLDCPVCGFPGKILRALLEIEMREKSASAQK